MMMDILCWIIEETIYRASFYEDEGEIKNE